MRAQTPLGNVTGLATDPSTAAVPNATDGSGSRVATRSTATSKAASAKSSSAELENTNHTREEN